MKEGGRAEAGEVEGALPFKATHRPLDALANSSLQLEPQLIRACQLPAKQPAQHTPGLQSTHGARAASGKQRASVPVCQQEVLTSIPTAFLAAAWTLQHATLETRWGDWLREGWCRHLACLALDSHPLCCPIFAGWPTTGSGSTSVIGFSSQLGELPGMPRKNMTW